MPGQRAKSKVPFGGFIDSKLHHKIAAAANKAGWRDNPFGFFIHFSPRSSTAHSEILPSASPASQ